MLVFSIGYLSLVVRERLKVGAVLNAVGRVDVDHLHLTAHALLFEEAVHHQQAVARDQAVAPVVRVPVELDCPPQGRVLLLGLEQRLLARAVALAYRLDDGAGVDPLVDVEGDGRNRKRSPLGLARPGQLRVEMRVMI